MSADRPQFLYIEDNVASRGVMETLLVEILGFSDLTMLDSTENAIQRLEATGKAFDVIFLDLMIEPLDGLSMCALFRNHLRFREAKIIAMTAEDSPADLAKVRSVGFDGLISKPLSPVKFPEQISQILSGKLVWEVS